GIRRPLRGLGSRHGQAPVDRNPRRSDLRLELPAPRAGGGLRERRREAEVRRGLRRRLDQGDEPGSLRSRVTGEGRLVPKSIAERYPRPGWVRRINAMADSVGGAAHVVALDPDELVALATSSTGLSEFGSFDGDWRGRLDALVAAIERTANLTVVGRLLTRQEILRCLRTRLFVTRELDRDPSILDEKIVAPIVVTGQGRSGTTILFELLALDPGLRSISATDAAHPVPPTRDQARLLAMTECEHELWSDVHPEFATIHEMGAHLPVECIHAMMPSFGSFQWWMFADVPDWAPDFVASLQFHKVILQLLQHGKPEATWVLKTPVYL